MDSILADTDASNFNNNQEKDGNFVTNQLIEAVAQILLECWMQDINSIKSIILTSQDNKQTEKSKIETIPFNQFYSVNKTKTYDSPNTLSTNNGNSSVNSPSSNEAIDERDIMLETTKKIKNYNKKREDHSLEWTKGILRFFKYIHISHKINILPPKIDETRIKNGKISIKVKRPLYDSRNANLLKGMLVEVTLGVVVQDMLVWATSISIEEMSKISTSMEKGINKMLQKFGGPAGVRLNKYNHGSCEPSNHYFYTCRREFDKDDELRSVYMPESIKNKAVIL